MRAVARARLPGVIADVVTAVERPFLQVVFDVEVPRMAFGRVCLVGDAAWVVRPHAAAGTAKAAADGWALADGTRRRTTTPRARWPRGSRASSPSAASCSTGPAASAPARRSTATGCPGDPELIFGLRGPGA